MTHLQRLEAESIHIFREVAAQFRNPVMLYSIGKDSSVLLHLALKAFYPSKPPFPLMHVDTTWKFREMTQFRDRRAAELGLDLIVHQNEDGVRQGINPFDHGSAVHTDVMKTQALKQALDKYKFDAAFGGARRDEEKSAAPRSGCFRSAPRPTAGTPRTSARSCGACTTPGSTRARASGCFRCRTGPSSTSGSTSTWRAFPVVPLYFAKQRPVVWREGTWIMVDDDRMPLAPGERPEHRKVRFRTLGCYPLTGGIESDAETCRR